MSFFPLELRDLDKKDPRGSMVGPGEYLPESKSGQKPGYAPFGSLTPKKRNKTMESTLGPGQYKIEREITQPSVNRYENRNIIIVKINDDGGHQFKSRTNRFQLTKGSDLGPGSYDTGVPFRKTKSTSVRRRPNIAEKVREINRQYYKEHREVSLLSDPLQTEPSSEYKGRKRVNTRGVLNWSYNKRERFTTDFRQEYTSQQKQRVLSQMIASRHKKVKPSAVFISKSMKSHLQSHIYKTNNSFKAELRKMIDFKDEDPGPGAYDIAKDGGNQAPNKFQFFGSTVERFPEGKKLDSLGPGSYKIDEKKQPQKNQCFQIDETTEKEDRYSYLPTNLENPGPGSYNAGYLIRQTTSEKRLNRSFGSRQPRFTGEKNGADPNGDENFQMTAYYKEKQERKEAELKIRKMMLESHGTPAFVSAAKRFEEPKQDQIEIGSYDVSQSDIAARMAKYIQMTKQLQQCQLTKPAFLSSQQRFKAERLQYNQHKDCWCLVKSVEKQMLEHESPAFACGLKRDIFESKAGVPPVGFYQNGGGSMIRDSFNSRFRKKAENQVKRSNAIKPQGNSFDRGEVYVSSKMTSS